MTTTRYIRHAIRFTSKTTGEQWWHSQELPTKYDTSRFGMAILYASVKHAEDATKTWRFRQYLESGTRSFEIVPIICEVPE
jgi:hypothetical protein